MKIATLALIIQNGHVLLGRKKKGEIGTNTLNGPGGKLEPGESLVDCVVRETNEELGIKLVPEQLDEVAVITFYAAGEPDFKVHVYRTDYFEGTLAETADMIPAWYPCDDLPLDQMLESDRMWFGKAIAGEKFRADVYYLARAKDFQRIEFADY